MRMQSWHARACSVRKQCSRGAGYTVARTVLGQQRCASVFGQLESDTYLESSPELSCLSLTVRSAATM